LKDAPILILDEPTSSIDSRTEAVILEALERLMEGRTTFIVAHRLSTIRHADRILVVSDGRIAEQGEHEELIGSGGLYSVLHSLQFDQKDKRAQRTAPSGPLPPDSRGGCPPFVPRRVHVDGPSR
jgi:ABC-type multidrug transport system fused ATPase/permease subunit